MTLRILLVDDEPDILTTMEDLLRQHLGMPAEVATASSGQEARAMVERGPPFDAVIADERMPGMRGSELLAWLGEAHPGTLRVLMTAYAERVVRAEGAPRADLLLFKPFQVPVMLQRLRASLGPRLPPEPSKPARRGSLLPGAP